MMMRFHSWIRINRIHHRFSVGTGKSQPKGPPFQWACRVSNWNGGPDGLGFPVDTVHQRSILFLM